MSDRWDALDVHATRFGTNGAPHCSQRLKTGLSIQKTGAGRADSLPLFVGLVPLVVGVAFVPPSGLAVMLGCLCVVKYLGGVGRLALGAGGPLVRSGGALMRPAPMLDLLVVLVLVVAGHRMSLPAGRPLTMIFETTRDAPVILSRTNRPKCVGQAASSLLNMPQTGWPNDLGLVVHTLRLKTERVGFEPTRQFDPPTRFPVVHLKPLGHLSGAAS